MRLEFVAYGKPQPQGSAKGFPIKRKNGKIGVVITSANEKVMPYRHTLTQVALEELRKSVPEGPLCPRETPVAVFIDFYLARPGSKPKRVRRPTYKPDADKLTRAVLDSLTGVAYEDDAQVVSISASKFYGLPERTEVAVYGLPEAIRNTA